jgi:hypothetical protein
MVFGGGPSRHRSRHPDSEDDVLGLDVSTVREADSESGHIRGLSFSDCNRLGRDDFDGTHRVARRRAPDNR